MKEKISVLVRTYHVIEVDAEELAKDNGILDKMIHEVSKDKTVDIGEEVFMKWEGTSTTPLLPEILNCGKCSNCGAWTTDREMEEAIEGLCNGATVDGVLLCDECLPEDHPLAY